MRFLTRSLYSLSCYALIRRCPCCKHANSITVSSYMHRLLQRKRDNIHEQASVECPLCHTEGKACISFFFSRHCKAAATSPRPLISDSTDFRGCHGILLTFAFLLLRWPIRSSSGRMVIPATLLVCLLIRVPIIMPILPPVFIPVSLL